MEEEIYINSHCSISDVRVSVNDTEIFKSDKTGPDFLLEVYEATAINYPKFYKMDELCKLGIIAAEALLKNIDLTKYNAEEVGIVLSNSNASIEADINYYESSKTFPSPSLFVYTLPNIVIGEISIRYGFKGENAFFISKKFNAQWLHFYVTDLMQQHGLKACVCGWLEVVNHQYEARLFLIEKGSGNGLNFTAGNLN